MPAIARFRTHKQASIYLTMAPLPLREEQKMYLKSIELNLHTGRVLALANLVFVPLAPGLRTTEQGRTSSLTTAR